MATEGALRNDERRPDKTELISIALEKLQRQRNICRYWPAERSLSIAASKKARALFSKIWDAKSKKCLMDGSQPPKSGSHFASAPSFAI